MEYKDRHPRIFILSGKAQSGKDSVASMIQEKYPNSIALSYAHYIKEYAKNITGWDGLEATKPRDVLQSLGIDLLKKIDEHFLINRICQDIEVYRYFYDVIIITDARLKEEIEIPQNRFQKVVVIRIEREHDNGLNEQQKAHITETALDHYHNYDYVITNQGDYNQLHNQVVSLLEEVAKHE